MSAVKRGKTGVPTRAFFLFGKMKGYRRFSMISYSLLRYDTTKVAQFRLEAIKFFEEFGLKATKKAFKVSKTTLYRWKKALEDNQGRLSSLVPNSTKPKRTRRMTTDARILGFIKSLREKHPRLGKVIKRNNFFYQKSGRVYHHPASKWALKSVKRKKRLRVKHPLKHQEFGHFQADSTFKFVDGLKRYFVSAIDTQLKFSFSACYSSLNSRNGKDFIQKLEKVYPLRIKTIQTDNGLEFLGECDQYLEKKAIPHYFTYPRCPRINGCIERYNRTLKEEFVNYHLDLIYNPKLFNQKMAEYLIFYNTKRAHKSLGLKSPMNYLIENGHLSHMCVTYTKT